MKLTLLFALISGLLIFLPVDAQSSRGTQIVPVKNEAGKTENVKLYEGSYALIIGVSKYTNGWRSLEGVKKDVVAVQEVLEKQGFTVRVVLDPTGEQLQAAINNFIRDYGFTFGNRLLFYYAGHGDTQPSVDGRRIGYIVPADAPLPSKDIDGFRQTAISMNDFEYHAQRIQAKHALFVFDSCFSGTMMTTTRGNIPPIINFKTTQPVRQFITAGSDDQEVPDVSEFRRQFVEGLNGEADLNGDGYITGSELADFLQTKVSNYTHEAQTPQYGKIRDGRLDKGDFVFLSGNKANPVKTDSDDANVYSGNLPRLALVLGNAGDEDYKLVTPGNDAADMSAALRSLGFEVMTGVDQNKKQMENLIQAFSDKLSKQKGIGLFYYSGYGTLSGGKKYIIPVDFKLDKANKTMDTAVELNSILSKFNSANNELNLVFLDAAFTTLRDYFSNEEPQEIRPKNTILFYGSEPGATVSDGQGRNGAFTEVLLKNIKRPNLELNNFYKAVTREVAEKSEERQVPFKLGSVSKDFYFVKPLGN